MARVRLATQYRSDPVGLSVLLAAHLFDAVDDLYALGALPDARALYARFVGWTGPRQRRPLAPR